eukprot:1159566-Pelagomonas_calceolata.AAC.2
MEVKRVVGEIQNSIIHLGENPAQGDVSIVHGGDKNKIWELKMCKTYAASVANICHGPPYLPTGKVAPYTLFLVIYHGPPYCPAKKDFPISPCRVPGPTYF